MPPDNNNQNLQAPTLGVAPASPSKPIQTSMSADSKSSFPKSRLFIIVIFLILIAVGSYVAYQLYFKPAPATQEEVVKVPLTLQVESPSDGMQIENNILVVNGKTSPNTTVAVFTDSDEKMVESNADGSFEATLMLRNGINTVTVTAFGEDGEEKSAIFDVIYDEEGKGSAT